MTVEKNGFSYWVNNVASLRAVLGDALRLRDEVGAVCRDTRVVRAVANMCVWVRPSDVAWRDEWRDDDERAPTDGAEED